MLPDCFPLAYHHFTLPAKSRERLLIGAPIGFADLIFYLTYVDFSFKTVIYVGIHAHVGTYVYMNIYVCVIYVYAYSYFYGACVSDDI